MNKAGVNVADVNVADVKVPGFGNIHFCGDPHGEFAHIIEAALRLRPMAVVLLGDIEARRPLHVELEPIRELVWWIAGNHDSDRAKTWRNLVDSDLAERRLDGRVVTLADGTRLAGLGGIFREQVWYPPLPARKQNYDAWHEELRSVWHERHWSYLPQLLLTHRTSIFPADYFGLARQQADILVTHEAGASHPRGFEAIDELASAMGVQATFHGHHHDRLDYSARWDELGLRAYGVGRRGITDRDGNVILPGDLDEQRAGRAR